MEMLKTLSYVHFAHVLDVPYGKFPGHQYQSDDQHKEATISHALHTHPCLSWKRLADNLQIRGYSGKAEEVMKKYVKGQHDYLPLEHCNYVSQDCTCTICATSAEHFWFTP